MNHYFNEITFKLKKTFSQSVPFIVSLVGTRLKGRETCNEYLITHCSERKTYTELFKLAREY